MAEPLIFINTYAIKEGNLEDYKKAAPEWLVFLEANHPRLAHFGAYINEDGTEATVVQVHPDADSMDLQMQIIADRVQEWQQYIEWDRMSSWSVLWDAQRGRPRADETACRVRCPAERQASRGRVPPSPGALKPASGDPTKRLGRTQRRRKPPTTSGCVPSSIQPRVHQS